jgi:hypothetical protein
LDTLIHKLHHSRIDREKLDATKNYLRNATDLGDLPDRIHEIMALFVFQASRRLLLSHIIQIYDESTKELETKDSVEVKERHEAVKSALKHADEEVRKLAYWSDVKHMAVEGKSRHAVDEEKGWENGWEGLDNSGPSHPNSDNLPGPRGS